MKLTDLRALLESHGLKPRQMFGQNFLVDPALLAAIPQDAGVEAGDRVLEVGPGAGSLTHELLQAGARVLAVEIDAGLNRLLRDRFEAELTSGQLELVHADVLDRDERFQPRVEEWWQEGSAPRVVANLPYAISGPFLARLAGRPLKNACLLLQREVAEKAASHTETGPLPIRLAAHFEARLGRRLPASVFWPRPRIESAFLLLEPKATVPTPEVDAALRELLRLAFSQRRKRVLGLLTKGWPESAEVLRADAVDEQARAEQIEPASWLRWAAALAELAATGRECDQGPNCGDDPA